MLIIVILSTDILEPEESNHEGDSFDQLAEPSTTSTIEEANAQSAIRSTVYEPAIQPTTDESRDQHPIQLSKQTRHWHFRSWRIPARGESESLVTAADSAITSRGGAWMQPTGNALFVLR